MGCIDKDKFFTSEASTKSRLRTLGVINEFLIIKNLQKFRELNTKWSDDAKARFNVKERLFFEDGNKAIPNTKIFKLIDNAKGTFYQEEGAESSVASPQTLALVRQLAEKMGISIKKLSEYDPNLKGVNAVTDLMRKVIAVAEGKEGVALTEEVVHAATAILEQTNPQMITQMISKIDRFAIYKATLAEYEGNKKYQLSDGKPDIRKIKKEAMDKLIAELLIGNEEGTTESPELQDEINRSLVRQWWNSILDFIRGIYKKANIDIFQEAAKSIAEGNVEGEITSNEVYYQLSKPQEDFQKLIKATDELLEKVVSTEKVDPLFLDSEEASNWYQIRATGERLKRRVTDRVKAWYKQRFRDKVFTEEEKAFNEMKRQLGVKYHGFFEEIHKRYFNSDGTKRSVAPVRPNILTELDNSVYTKLERYYVNLIDSFSKDGKTPLVFSEVILYDAKVKEAGTLDLLIIEENGKANIFDWKFMSVGVNSTDVAWYKQGAYNIQLGRYKEMLKSSYGIKSIGMNRAIPIILDIKKESPKLKVSPMKLEGILIGSVNVADIEDLRLVPVSEETESTGIDKLDELIRELNAALKQTAKKMTTNEEKQDAKRERLNIIRKAIRAAQSSENIEPLVDVIKVIRKEGQQILDDYKMFYKDKAANSKEFSNKQLSDFAVELKDYRAMSEVFSKMDILIGALVYTKEMEAEANTDEQKEEVKERKETLSNIQEEVRLIRESQEDVIKVSKEFADKFIGIRNLVTGLLNPEAVVKGLSSLFRGVSELAPASLQILFKLVTNAQSRASQTALGEVNELLEIRKKLSARGGNLRDIIKQIYQKDNNHWVNKLIYRFDKKFFTDVDANAAEGARDKKWLLDNIDVDAYKEEADKVLKERISRYNRIYDEDEELRDKLIQEEKQKWDITRKDFSGWNNYIIKRHPLAKWETAEYTDLKKDTELFSLYNFVSKMNDKAKECGYIKNKVASTFLPYIRKSMAESMAWDFSLSAISNWADSLSLKGDDVGYGSYNEHTGELENSIPKYFTQDFTKTEAGTNDYSDVSEDLFKNLILYVNHMEKYKYLSEVEGQLSLVKTVETFKKHLNTNRTGDVIFEDGVPQAVTGNEENTKMFDDFLRALLYEQKYPLSDSDTPLGIGKVMNFMKKSFNNLTGTTFFTPNDNPSATSLVKTMDAANSAFQLKTLGLEFISGSVNIFGGNIQVATQAGGYFKAREFLANELILIGNKFKNDDNREMFIQMVDLFMPLKDDPTYEKLKASGMTTLTRINFADALMVFMREPEQHLEKSVFLTLLQNMMVEDGKIVSIREYVKSKHVDRNTTSERYKEAAKQMKIEIEELKSTRSIEVTKKLVDGKLVIPGLDLSNIEELQRLTNLTRRISRNATGALSNFDLNRMGMSVWTKSMMVFKNWIPKLVDTRFSEFRRVSDDFSVTVDEEGLTTGEKYDIGRIRLWGYVIGTSLRDKSLNVVNILSMNEKGIALLNKMYEEFGEKYEKRTGKPFTMDRDAFIDLMRTNLRNQMKEVAIGLSLVGGMMSLGLVQPPDDADKADKNFYRFSQRVINKFITELSFFYNPVEFQRILSGGAFPAIGIFNDIEKFTTHFFMETTGLDLSNPDLTPEEVMKKAQPIKYGAKMFPVTKSMITYMSIFSSDFAKEFDVTIQKQSNR